MIYFYAYASHILAYKIDVGTNYYELHFPDL
jgi:hypothetical protein